MPDILDNFPPEAQGNLHAILALRIANSISVALIVHDWIRDFRKEMSIWGDFFRGKVTSTLIAFIIQRYTAQIAAWAAFTFLFGGPSINCQALVSTVYGSNILFAAGVSYIFAQRTFALYNYHRVVVVGLSLLWTGLVACYVIVSTQYRAIRLPIAFEGCNCAITSAGKISLLGFAASLVFDLVVLILTLGRLYYLRLKSQLGDTIRSTSIVYFAAVSSVNLALVLIIAISDNPTINATPLGPAFAITYLLLNSMIFGMRDRSRRNDKTSVGMATEHLEHYRKNSQLNNRSGGGILGNMFSKNHHNGTGSGGSMSKNLGGAGTQQQQGAMLDNHHGIPMSVTVAQKSTQITADPHSDENLFSHLRSQAAAGHVHGGAMVDGDETANSLGSHSSQHKDQFASATEIAPDLEYGHVHAANGAHQVHERRRSAGMQPHGPFYS